MFERISAPDWGALGIYLIITIGVGVYFARGRKNSEDFLLGGRKMPWLAIGISYFIALLSTVSLVSVPGEVFNYDFSMAITVLFGPIFSIIAFHLFMGFYFSLKVFTPFKYLEERFDRKTRLLISTMTLLSRFVYLALVLYASAVLFYGAAGVPLYVTILVVGIIGIVCTAMGGLKTVVATDIFQFLIVGIGLGVLLWATTAELDGGLIGGIRYAFENGKGFGQFEDPRFFRFDPEFRLNFWILIIGSFMAYVYGNSADQIAVQHLISTSSYQQAKKALWAKVIITIPFAGVLWLVGLCIWTFYDTHPDRGIVTRLAEGVTTLQGDTALFRFIAEEIPTPLPGLLLAAMLAAVLSTMQAGFNALTAIGLKDYVILFTRDEISESKQVWWSRMLTVLIGATVVVIALFMGLTTSGLKESVMEASTIWYAMTGAVAPTFLLAVCSRRFNVFSIWMCAWANWGVSAGMVCWYMVSKTSPGPIDSLWFVVPLVLTVVLCGVALLRRHNSDGRGWVYLAVCFTCFSGATWQWWLRAAETSKPLSFAWVGIPGLAIFFLVAWVLMPFQKPRVPQEGQPALNLWDVWARKRSSKIEKIN